MSLSISSLQTSLPFSAASSVPSVSAQPDKKDTGDGQTIDASVGVSNSSGDYRKKNDWVQAMAGTISLPASTSIGQDGTYSATGAMGASSGGVGAAVDVSA